MTGIICSMVGASFTVAAAAEVLRSKKGISAVGNAQIDTAQSKFGGSALLCDGVNDYLAVTTSEIFTGDFTMEMWIRPSAVNMQYQTLIQVGTEAPGRYVWHVYYDGLFVNLYGSGTYDIFTSGVNLTANTWAHVAVVRNESTVTIYVNGTSRGTNTAGVTNYGNTGGYYIAASDTAAQDFGGHMDEIRISNIARYTANFTAPTAAFVNDANTVLLIHANGTDASTFFEDDNGVRASRSLIAIGNAQVDTAQSKFGGSALLCDGTGDYVMSPAGTQWDFATSSFTIEYFIRVNAINTLYVPIALRASASIGIGEWWCEITAAENKMYWGFKNQAGTQYYVNLALAGTAFATGQFYHIALVNNAGTAQMYVNGTATGATTALSGSFGISTTDLWVGAGAGAYSVNGWMDEIRISNTARYTTTFTPTTTPFVNDANTLLLIHADGTDGSTVFRDDNGVRASTGLIATGSAQVSTAQSKFGGASALFNGNSNTQILGRGWNTSSYTGDFTIEGWFYITDKTTQTNARIWSDGDGTTTEDYRLLQFEYSTNQIYMVTGQSGNDSWNYSYVSATLNINTWYHIAASRSGSSLRIFVNGTQQGSTISNSLAFTTASSNHSFRLGMFRTDASRLRGYIDDFRISNSARYTANFTAPTTPFVNDVNTLLLIHADGTNASTTFTDDNA